MSRTAIVFLVGLVAACDRVAPYADCPTAIDPGAPGGQRDCPGATFDLKKDVNWRNAAGVVHRGENPVAGATVRVVPTPGFFAGDQDALVVSASTDAVGAFGPLRGAALRYDLSVRDGADVIVYRSVGSRYVNPTFESNDRSLARAWLGRLDVQLDPAPGDDQRVAFFAGGDRAFGMTGDLAHGVFVAGLDYATPATVHAIVYAKDGDLATASAYGRAEVIATPGAPQVARIRLEPITDFRETTIVPVLPEGFIQPDTVEVLFGYSRTSFATLTRMKPGVVTRLPVVPNATFTAYRVRASSPAGATADSGERFYDLNVPEVSALLEAPPVAVAPADGASADASTRLEATGKGVFEHVLQPRAPGTSLHVLSGEGSLPIPDVTTLGAAPLRGTYDWVVRSYPTLVFPDQLGGVDARRYPVVTTSSPRAIVFP